MACKEGLGAESALAKQELRGKKELTEKELWLRHKEFPSDDTRNALIIFYLSLVRYLAERLKARLPSHIDVADLCSSGILGLADAIRNFNPEKNVKFKSFSVLRIRGAMLDDIRDRDWVPRAIRTKISSLAVVTRTLARKLGIDPPPDEAVASALEISVSELEAWKKEISGIAHQTSLEGLVSKGTGSDRSEMLSIEDKRCQTPFQDIQYCDAMQIVSQAIEALRGDEYTLAYRYYILGVSMKEVAESLGLSEARVCQINNELLPKLRQKLESRGVTESIFDLK